MDTKPEEQEENRQARSEHKRGQSVVAMRGGEEVEMREEEAW